MMNTDAFINKWEHLKNSKGYQQRIDTTHPLDFFIGINENGHDELILITVNEPVISIKTGKSLEVYKKIRKDGRWALIISSVFSENQDVFAKLCLDLFESSRNCTSEKEGLKLILKRFNAWQKLFMTMKETLNDSVLKGLVGELVFAEKYVSKRYGWKEALEAWQGPDGADRDFILPDNWFEIKTTSVGKKTVTISSLNQLETDMQGYLVIVFIEKTTATDPASVSVSGLIGQIREKLDDYPDALMIFEQKLVSIGYIDKAAYDNIYFRYSEEIFYNVDSNFPRITTHDVPVEIVSAHYELSLPAIDKWKKDVNDVWT